MESYTSSAPSVKSRLKNSSQRLIDLELDEDNRVHYKGYSFVYPKLWLLKEFNKPKQIDDIHELDRVLENIGVVQVFEPLRFAFNNIVEYCSLEVDLWIFKKQPDFTYKMEQPDAEVSVMVEENYYLTNLISII